MGWAFLIVVSTLIVMPIYRMVMRGFSGSGIYVFGAIAVSSSLICFILLNEDPRGVAGPGYLVIFLFGPFAIGWICNGILSFVAWAIGSHLARISD